MNGNPSTSIPDAAYQHWLDDAANMGLMLYRMRQDSRRERLLRGGHHHPSSGTPPRVKPPLVVPDPPVVVPPSPAAVASSDPTPRTSAALQTPTVATAPSTPPASAHQPHPLYLSLD